MQIDFNPEHNHLWPVILEQCYDAFRQTKKTGFTTDIFSLTLTSKSIFKSIFETAITLNIRMVQDTFKRFLESFPISNNLIKFNFDPCNNLFDVQIEKIKTLRDMYLLLNSLSDTTKVVLRSTLSEKPGEMIFRSSIRALKTDEEIAKVLLKDQPNNIQFLITTGQFEKASTLLFKYRHKFSLQTKKDVNNDLKSIVAMHKDYALLHYPQLRPSERAMVVRYILQKIPFEKEAMVDVIKTLTKRYDEKEEYFQLAIITYLTSTLRQCFQENDLAKKNVLKSVCLSIDWLKSCYEDVEDNFNLTLIDNLLATHSFNSALKIQANLYNCSKKENALSKMIKADIDLKLNNYDYPGAIHMAQNHMNTNLRNSNLSLIAETALSAGIFDFAMLSTALITTDALENKDLLYFKILEKQEINSAIKTFELIQNKENHITNFCLLLPNMIVFESIPKALKIIDTHPNHKIRQKALKLLKEKHFQEIGNVNRWLEFGSNINSFVMRLKFLNDFFKGLSKEELHHFFKNADAFYLDFSEILMSADLTKAMNFMDTLDYNSEKMIALHLLVDRLLISKEIFTFLEAIYKSNLSDLVTILFKMKNKDISIALDIVNSFSDVEYRLELLTLIYQRINPDDDVRMIESTIKEINDNDDPDERLENLKYLIC